MSNPLTLQLILQGAAKAAAELKPLDAKSRAAADGLKQARDALKMLNGQMGQLGGIRQAQAALTQQANSLKVLRTNLDSVTRTYGSNSEQARALQAQVDKASAAYDKQRHALVQLRSAATTSGLGNLIADESRLKTEITAANSAIAQQRARLEALAGTHARVAQVRQRFDGTRATAGHIAVAGAGGVATAYGVKRAVTEPLHQVREYETTKARIAALGLSNEETQEIVSYANNLKAYGVSKNEKMGLALDASTAFADAHEAKMVLPTLTDMKFANRGMFGEEQGAENERKFMDLLKVIEARGGLKSKDEFTKQADMVQRVITATGGRVDSTQWLDFIKRGGIAAKGLSSEAMYYQMEPIVQIMSGASAGVGLRGAYQNLYQGRTTKRAAQNLESLGLIGDPSKVKHDKTGQTSSLNPGALLGSDLFRNNQFEWMEKVLLPQLAKKGITGEKEIVDAIGSIFSNTSASGLFSQMLLMRDQIHKNAKLNAGADGIAQLKERAKGTIGGQELEAEARFNDAMLSSGDALRPVYVKLLNTVTPLLEGFSKFVQENPRLAESLGTVVTIVGIAAAGFGGLGLALAAMLGPFAIINLGLGLFGIKAVGVLGILKGVSSALLTAGGALMRFGLMLLTTPIGWFALAVAGIATAAFLIYKNWGPISTFFSGVWESVKGAFASFWQYLGGSVPAALATVGAAIVNWSPLGLFYQAFAGVMQWFGIELPAKFTTFGSQIMQGVANGIVGGLGWVKDAIVSAADSTVAWFREKLGIRSPSRVFMEAGVNIGEGAAMGIDRTLPMLRAAALGLAGAATTAMPAMAGFDTRPPLSAAGPRGAGGGVIVQGDTISITIVAKDSDSAQSIAGAVRAELDRRDAAKRARARGAFIDYDN